MDTFEPGKKYSCIPSADRKGWDCKQSGTATNAEAAPAQNHAAAVAPASVSHCSDRACTHLRRRGPPRPLRLHPFPPVVQARQQPRRQTSSGALPNYLKATAASPPPASPGPIPAAPPVAVPAAVAQAPVPATTSRPVAAPPVAPATVSPARHGVAAPAPQTRATTRLRHRGLRLPNTSRPHRLPPSRCRLERPAPSPPSHAASASGSFLDLPGDHYVIELAHGEREADVASARTALHVPHGEVYELHLRQNGSDNWLLVWGSFGDVGAARVARGELPADVHAGWPRRVAPLQAEVRAHPGIAWFKGSVRPERSAMGAKSKGKIVVVTVSTALCYAQHEFHL